jgi:uncharacterized protein (DUF488 family)
MMVMSAPSERDRAPHRREGSSAKRLYSVGYEGLEVRDLIDHLISLGVSLLVDVRLNAVSRKPGWSKRSLTAELASAGIEYRHEPTLGNPPENRTLFHKKDGEEGRRRMRTILESHSQPALQRLVDEAGRRHVAVLCVERAAQHCHRQVITDVVQEVDPSIEVPQIS